MIKKGRLIEVENMDFCQDKRTIKVFLRGVSLKDCEFGEQTEIITSTGHIVRGVVSERKYFYDSSKVFGKNVKEILCIK
ncbi:hypothetical protein ACFHWD_13610 [Clostridium sp. MT-14]|jgi:cephalosporin-C deacetylase-like acetyl esterase|uniref:Uncharacterized protein n=1 Tax=Clostridium aromativorans TaxID=2836848 RepID=A0ABS8N7C0_9CLOT|nr:MULTISPECIES: hypothetical protein [Clostridium]KAA8670982.1 hypothetical protein F3O63_11705 [Clostridium sp. HV4-5-A1G]MCC9295699.1 hypothetical protein [Clostridium aromativorans]CAB1243225.1 conserved hypothetical protein [Clostridiaceae bacterium BL-3]